LEIGILGCLISAAVLKGPVPPDSGTIFQSPTLQATREKRTDKMHDAFPSLNILETALLLLLLMRELAPLVVVIAPRPLRPFSGVCLFLYLRSLG
jgi:hypothetical protein